MSKQTIRVCDLCGKQFAWNFISTMPGVAVSDFYTYNDLDVHVECYEQVEVFLKKLGVPKFSYQVVENE